MNENNTSAGLSSSEKPTGSPEDLRRQRLTMVSIVFAVIVLLAVLITCIVLLLLPSTDASTVTRIRDVFIIFMALESLLIGLVLVILIVQLARLTNLLQNEIKPILDSTNETVSTLRGTTAFLSANLVEPVMKLNESLAGLHKLLEILGIGRKRP
jgi:quinol-cytochrome oxidoreductase complex cytochrome b subunit